MDDSETIAKQHLMSRGYTKIIYEPDGNVPPDFLVDGRIAVEVRRLNENKSSDSKPRGLELVRIPLLRRLETIFSTYGQTQQGSWFLCVRFKRPVPEWNTLEPKVKSFLSELLVRRAGGSMTLRVGENLELEAIRRTTIGDAAFTLGFIEDLDSGGWLFQSLARNLRLCIDEKTHKVRARRSKHPEWWLLFVDHLSYALFGSNLDEFLESVCTEHDWDRVILVNPVDHQRFVEIESGANHPKKAVQPTSRSVRGG